MQQQDLYYNFIQQLRFKKDGVELTHPFRGTGIPAHETSKPTPTA
jgi:hypothetical protein